MKLLISEVSLNGAFDMKETFFSFLSSETSLKGEGMTVYICKLFFFLFKSQVLAYI